MKLQKIGRRINEITVYKIASLINMIREFKE